MDYNKINKFINSEFSGGEREEKSAKAKGLIARGLTEGNLIFQVLKKEKLFTNASAQYTHSLPFSETWESDRRMLKAFLDKIEENLKLL